MLDPRLLSGLRLNAKRQTARLSGRFNRTFDVVIEASGAIEAFNTALKAVKQKGRISILSNIQLAHAEILLLYLPDGWTMWVA